MWWVERLNRFSLIYLCKSLNSFISLLALTVLPEGGPTSSFLAVADFAVVNPGLPGGAVSAGDTVSLQPLSSRRAGEPPADDDALLLGPPSLTLFLLDLNSLRNMAATLSFERALMSFWFCWALCELIYKGKDVGVKRCFWLCTVEFFLSF